MNDIEEIEEDYCPRRRWMFENNETKEAIANQVGRPKIPAIKKTFLPVELKSEQIQMFFDKGLNKEQIARIMGCDLKKAEVTFKRYGF